MTSIITPPTTTEPRQRWRALALISIATLFSLSVWFSTNAVADALQREQGFSNGDLAWLTIAVQIGFVIGTMAIAATNLADIINTRRLFFISAILGAAANLALVFVPDGFGPFFALRILTGIFLGGVYPPGMKIVSGWFRSGRGIAIGVMIGALTLGSGSPHLLRSIFAADWHTTIYISSAMALVGGLIVYFMVSDGPFDVPAQRFNPKYMLETLRRRSSRLVLFGYLGHMWELYAMWAWIGAFLTTIYGQRFLVGDSLSLASLIAFLTFLAGAVGCVLGGLLAQRWGRCLVTSVAMVLSGGTALYLGFLPADWGWLIAIVAIVWGTAIIADSGQFSTAMTEVTDPAYRGTALTFQTGLGFLLTVLTIRMVPIIEDAAGWGVTFALLAIGPVFGTASMMWLRTLPEAEAIAGGKR
jgi:MFS family permease